MFITYLIWKWADDPPRGDVQIRTEPSKVCIMQPDYRPLPSECVWMVPGTVDPDA